jgi:hypothetical protein
MPRKADSVPEEDKENESNIVPLKKEEKEDEAARLNRMLGAVMKYISDDEIQEIDIEYLLDTTEGLREWWEKFREMDRKRVEEEIKNSLKDLSLDELQKLREQIRGTETP